MFRGKKGVSGVLFSDPKKSKKKLICKFFAFLNKCGVSGTTVVHIITFLKIIFQ